MIFSKQRNVLAVQRERKSMLCRIKKLPNKTAEEHENAVWQSIESLPRDLWKTITRDNGTENAKHFHTTEIFGIPSFYCDGYKGQKQKTDFYCWRHWHHTIPEYVEVFGRQKRKLSQHLIRC